ncbi:nitrogen permease regulator 2-domain-containing protein [Lophiotrema nucula]|uniref:Nitrogen permease regulator 2-domain-containing protein n=1 Tax=Lophiotrema nucula TaxID=690887 RepID=A0A6A5Z7H3_9PLEO|nr:nitrogen permease regulator 2-domain-containing protein [Lophiotrema nucula]
MPPRAIKAIFFTRFHHEKGSRVLHQVPEGSITPSTSPAALSQPLFAFDSITTYLIPTQQFCDRLLTFCVNHYRIIGYPVCIREGKYSRNEFIFNFAIVVEEGVADWVAYGEVVRKLGRLLRGLEEQAGFLSREEVGVWEDEGWQREGGRLLSGGGSKVYALCEMILEDLNNYAECMIPIDESNTINLKLFPTHSPPPPIHAHHVPLLTISLHSLTSPLSSDLTLTRIIPFINGIHSVSHIAQLADTDLSLTRKAIQHLVYYNCVVLLDIFSFGAVYAPTAEIGGYITDQAVQEECARYVRVPRMRFGSGVRMGSESTPSQSRDRGRGSSLSSEPSDTAINEPAYPSSNADATPTLETLITLYTSLRQGVTLRTFVLENLSLLHGIDIRRFVTFGVIKGFLYRVHKYPVSTSTGSREAHGVNGKAAAGLLVAAPLGSTGTGTSQASTVTLQGQNQAENRTESANPNPNPNPRSQQRLNNHRPSIASTNLHLAGIAGLEKQADMAHAEANTAARLGSIISSRDDREADLSAGLVKFLDGMHCFDEICTETGVGEGEVERRIKGVGVGAGDVVVVFR